jgi:hypothetical protein
VIAATIMRGAVPCHKPSSDLRNSLEFLIENEVARIRLADAIAAR